MLDETSVDNLIQNIEMPAFGYDRKLIIVKNSGLFKKDGRRKTASPLQERVGEYIKNNYGIINHLQTFGELEKVMQKNLKQMECKQWEMLLDVQFIMKINYLNYLE